MSGTAEAAKNTVEIGKKHILDQRLRIERQRELIERLRTRWFARSGCQRCSASGRNGTGMRSDGGFAGSV